MAVAITLFSNDPGALPKTAMRGRFEPLMGVTDDLSEAVQTPIF